MFNSQKNIKYIILLIFESGSFLITQLTFHYSNRCYNNYEFNFLVGIEGHKDGQEQQFMVKTDGGNCEEECQRQCAYLKGNRWHFKHISERLMTWYNER